MLIAELIESAMYLYRATGDPFLHEVAIDIVESIEHNTKTKCGYATVSYRYLCPGFSGAVSRIVIIMKIKTNNFNIDMTGFGKVLTS